MDIRYQKQRGGHMMERHAPVWSGLIRSKMDLGGRPITLEMIREAEEELGLREIIDAGVSALEEGDVRRVIADAVVIGVSEAGSIDGNVAP